VTAPDGLAVVRKLLDQLDTAHAAATPGPWRVPSPFMKLVDVPSREASITSESAADAAVIVADHNAVPQLVSAVRTVLDRHQPWYEAGGKRHDNLVTVGCADYDGCDADGVVTDCAASDGDGHEVLACNECRCVVDCEMPGYLLWPCPTVRAVVGALTAGSADR
jgi:hypothetical protein